MILSKLPKLIRNVSANFFLIALFLPQYSNAASFLTDSVLTNGEWVFQGGGYYSEMGQSQHIDINSSAGNQYNVSDKSTYNITLGAGYYLKPKSLANHSIQYGLNIFYLHNATVDGTIRQENLFTNLGYSYRANHLPVYAMLKMPHVFHSKVSADVGIGPNVMFLSRVKERSLDGGVTNPNNAFRSRTDVGYSATVGLTVPLMADAKYPISCGYRFFYLGEGRFKKATTQLLDTLKTGQSYAHALTCQISV